MDVEIVGDARQFQDVAARLDRLSQDLMRDVGHGIVRAVEPLPAAARRSALQLLPRAGGLAARVSRTDMPIVPRLGRAVASVLIPARPGAVKDPGAINRGRVRHPVYGHWVGPRGTPNEPLIQIVAKGWFTQPMRSGTPAVREAILDEIRRALRRAQG